MIEFILPKNGVHKSTVRETPYWIQEYPIKWDEPKLNLAKLAKLRFIDGLDRHQLAKHFDVSPNIISCALDRMRKTGFDVEGLHQGEKERIAWASQN